MSELRPILETRRWIYILEKKEELIMISDHLAGHIKKMAITQTEPPTQTFLGVRHAFLV